MGRHGGRQLRQGAAGQRGRHGGPPRGSAGAGGPLGAAAIQQVTALLDAHALGEGRGGEGGRGPSPPDGARRRARIVARGARGASPSPAGPARSRSRPGSRPGRDTPPPRTGGTRSPSRQRSTSGSSARRAIGAPGSPPALRLASVAPWDEGSFRLRLPRVMGRRDAVVAASDLVIWAGQFMDGPEQRARFMRVLWLVRSLEEDELDEYAGFRDAR